MRGEGILWFGADETVVRMGDLDRGREEGEGPLDGAVVTMCCLVVRMLEMVLALMRLRVRACSALRFPLCVVEKGSHVVPRCTTARQKAAAIVVCRSGAG